MFSTDPAKSPLLGSSIINQYFLLLGEFGNMELLRSYGDYEGSAKGWVYTENVITLILFAASTFFSQIVTLNMLVAIMSATFDRHSSDLHQNEQRQKLVLQSEFTILLNTYRWAFGCCCRKRGTQAGSEPADFLFVVTRDKTAKHDEAFGPRSSQGKAKASKGGGKAADQQALTELKTTVEDKFRELDSFLNKKVLNQLQDLTQDMRIRMTNIEKGQQESEKNLKRAIFAKIAKLQSKIDAIEKATGNMKKEVIDEMNEDVGKHVNKLNVQMLKKMDANLKSSVEAIRRLQIGQKVQFEDTR